MAGLVGFDTIRVDRVRLGPMALGRRKRIVLRSSHGTCGAGDSMDELTAEECLHVLEDGWVGHLGVVSEGEPYVAPISYVVVDRRVCFKTGPGRRAEALRSSPRVCLETSNVDQSTGHWESVVVWGNAEEIIDDLEAQAVISALVSKYRPILGSPLSPGPSDVGLVERDILMALPIETITGRTSGSLFHIATRPGRL